MSKDFEQQAKKLGDDFKLQPREDLWLRIEESLDDKKRRRGFWWWAAPIALLLGSGVAFYAMQPNGKQISPEGTASASSTQKIAPQKIADNTSTSSPTSNYRKNDQPQTASASIAANNTVSSSNHTYQASTTNKSKNSFSQGLDRRTPQNKLTAHSLSNPGEGKAATEHITSNAEPKTLNGSSDRQVAISSSQKNSGHTVATGGSVIVNTAATAADDKNLPLASSKSVQADETTVAALPDTLSTETVDSAQAIVAVVTDSADQMTTTTAKSTLEKSKHKNAQWYVKAGAGMSKMAGIDLATQKSFDAATGLTAPNTVVVNSPAREDKSSFEFRLAVQRTQNITKRLQWNAALGWQLQQVKQYFGKKVDSTIYYNTQNSQLTFSNRYFYTSGSNSYAYGTNNRIYLTNELSWQVLPKQTWLHAGLGIYTGVNIANNFYVEDYMQRLVKNKDLYTTWFLGVSPGIEYVFKNQWRIGLQSYFDLTKAYKEFGNNSKYWRGWELNTSIPIPKSFRHGFKPGHGNNGK